MLYRDLNITRDESPVMIYTQAGSGAPRPHELRPEDGAPHHISSVTPFIIYLDDNANVRMEVLG